MKTYDEFITESVKVSKGASDVIDQIKHLYNIDLAPHVIIGNKRKFFSFDVSELDDNALRNVERFAHDKSMRMEKSGHKQYAIYLG